MNQLEIRYKQLAQLILRDVQNNKFNYDDSINLDQAFNQDESYDKRNRIFNDHSNAGQLKLSDLRLIGSEAHEDKFKKDNSFNLKAHSISVRKYIDEAKGVQKDAYNFDEIIDSKNTLKIKDQIKSSFDVKKRLSQTIEYPVNTRARFTSSINLIPKASLKQMNNPHQRALNTETIDSSRNSSRQERLLKFYSKTSNQRNKIKDKKRAENQNPSKRIEFQRRERSQLKLTPSSNLPLIQVNDEVISGDHRNPIEKVTVDVQSKGTLIADKMQTSFVLDPTKLDNSSPNRKLSNSYIANIENKEVKIPININLKIHKNDIAKIAEKLKDLSRRFKLVNNGQIKLNETFNSSWMKDVLSYGSLECSSTSNGVYGSSPNKISKDEIELNKVKHKHKRSMNLDALNKLTFVVPNKY